MKYLLLGIFALSLFACNEIENEGHDHDDNSHEVSTNIYTIWTDKTELFVEFPVLVVGKQSRFAAHFTKLEGHQPIIEGQVTVSLLHGTKGIRQTVNNPASPGIFIPVLEPVESGKSTLTFILNAKEYLDTIQIENIDVYPDMQSASQNESLVEEDGTTITFLKEQAWKMPFQTEKVKVSKVYETVTTSGKWEIAPNNSHSFIANANGKVNFIKNNLIPGQNVKKGEVVMSINSNDFVTNTLSGDIEVARIEYQQAADEYNRKKELYNDKIIPDSEFEMVEKKYLVSKSRYETLSSGFSQSGYSSSTLNISSPVSGYLQDLHVSNGSFVKEGDLLFTVNSPNSMVLNVRVPVRYSEKMESIHDIQYRSLQNEWASMRENNGFIVSMDRMISEQKPSINMYAMVNSKHKNTLGSFAEVIITLGEVKKGIVIPKSALLEDYGNYSVIVQLGGEVFEKRNVVIGKKTANGVEILEGLDTDEIIVTKGAYQVKMQSLSGQAPAHGHAH